MMELPVIGLKICGLGYFQCDVKMFSLSSAGGGLLYTLCSIHGAVKMR